MINATKLIAAKKLWRTDLTGLRALAVVPVLFYHAFPSLLPNGYLGVDIFFVISGYLISGIIFRDLILGEFSLKIFYEKRVRRILPNLILCLVFCILVGYFFLMDVEYSNLAKHSIASLLFIQNFNLLSEIGYFTEDALRKPLLHLWSLAIEEQFYIIFPLVCMYLYPKIKNNKKRGGAYGLMIGVIIFASLLCLYTSENKDFNFYFPLSRFWELGIGIALAYIEVYQVIDFQKIDKGLRGAISIIGLCLVLASIFNKYNSFIHPGPITFIPVLGSAMLILARPDAFINCTLLSWKPLTYVGLISYSLYLWHWPLLSYLFLIVPDASNWQRILVLIFSFILSATLYHTFEQPIRRSQFRWKHVGVPSIILSCSVFLAFYALFAIENSGFPNRVVNKELKSYVSNVRTDTASNWKEFRTTEDYGSSLKIYGKGFPRILFVGDSHMYAYQHRVMDLSEQYGESIGFLTDPGCEIYSGAKYWGDTRDKQRCTDKSKIFYRLLNDSRIDKIVLAQMWGSYISTNSKKMQSQKGIRTLQIALLNNNKKLFIILDAPWDGYEKQFDPLNHINRINLELSNFWVSYSPDGEWKLGNEYAKQAFNHGAEFIAPEAFVCDKVKNVCNSINYRDWHHLRNSYLREQAFWLDNIFK